MVGDGVMTHRLAAAMWHRDGYATDIAQEVETRELGDPRELPMVQTLRASAGAIEKATEDSVFNTA